MKKSKTASMAALMCAVLALTGCGMKNKTDTKPSEPMNSMAPEETAQDAQDDAPSASAMTVGSYSFSWLEADADGTTTSVTEDAYTLRYNADWFTLMKEEGNDYLASFAVHGPVGVEHMTARIVRPSTDEGFPADCYDYFNLKELDDAKEDELKTLDTDVGRVTYYICVSNLNGNGYNSEAYYALNVGQVAFCGVMDVVDDAAGVLIDETMARTYITQVFEEGTARQIFENLFVEVVQNEAVKEQS